MSIGIRRPHQAVDYDEIARMFPPPPEYFDTTFFGTPEEIERVQLGRLKQRALLAYEVPFFRRRWDVAGFDPRSIQSLADLDRVPPYTVDDIRKSIEAHPPYGDYQGVAPELALREPMRIYMSGGTTGASRPTFYTQWDREIGSILMARGLYQHGIRPGDVVLNSWSYGLHNGAWAYDEALYRWLNCVVITASAGNVTSSEKQVELAVEYGARAILATGDFLLRIADVAKKKGYELGTDLKFTALSTTGDRATMEAAFGLPYYHGYGVHEIQWMAAECSAHAGLHIMEDAFVVQVVQPETGELLPDGQTGTLVITELYKTGSPQFRYNSMDLSFLYPRERCECGSWMRRMGPFGGRADNMVKLRGVMIWPEAVGDVVATVPGASTDYFVRAIRKDNRDEMIVSVVSSRETQEFRALVTAIEKRLFDAFAVRISAEVVRPGDLDELTEVNSSPKAKHFRDERLHE